MIAESTRNGRKVHPEQERLARRRNGFSRVLLLGWLLSYTEPDAPFHRCPDQKQGTMIPDQRQRIEQFHEGRYMKKELLFGRALRIWASAAGGCTALSPGARDRSKTSACPTSFSDQGVHARRFRQACFQPSPQAAPAVIADSTTLLCRPRCSA